jgi:hypothetical protein
MLNMDQCSRLVATHCSLPAIGEPPHHADDEFEGVVAGL